jgi:cytochrome c-type biogenesis protein CcmF
MNGLLGHIGISLGFASALAGAAVIGWGLWRGRPDPGRSSWVYIVLLVLGALLATFAMERALITHDFSLSYVADNNSRQTPLLYTVTGLWSALQGSMLLWGLVLSGYIAATAWRFRSRLADPLVAWALLVALLVAAFFFALMVGPADPFRAVVGAIPPDGAGPNVLLQDNPLVALHPPLLYLGYIGFTVPFAFAIASLITGRVDEAWQSETRRWTLFSWAALTIGILLGAWWSYEVLGWGGFWAWDPVENAAFLPWLCATAYLHSALVQERRGLLRVWNLSLIIATFSLTILGTFLTRSGVIESVHAFSDSGLGPALITFFGVVLLVGLGLIAWRGDALRSPVGIDSALSREGAFLLNNLLFVGFAFVVLLGTVFPLLFEAFRGQQVTVGAPYFNTLTVPISLALLVLMAVGPALPWRKTTVDTLASRLVIPAWVGGLTIAGCVLGGVRGLGPLLVFGLGGFAAAANVRQLVLSARAARRVGVGMWRGLIGRANGGMVVHLGVVVVAVAFSAATSFAHRGEVTLVPGQATVFDGHRILYRGMEDIRTAASTASAARIFVDGRGPFLPAVTSFGPDTQAVGTPSIDSGPFRDVYLTLDAYQQGAPKAPISLGVAVQALVLWLWVGGGLLGLGALLALLPGGRRRPTDPVSAPAPAIQAKQSAPRPPVVVSGAAP